MRKKWLTHLVLAGLVAGIGSASVQAEEITRLYQSGTNSNKEVTDDALTITGGDLPANDNVYVFGAWTTGGASLTAEKPSTITVTVHPESDKAYLVIGLNNNSGSSTKLGNENTKVLMNISNSGELSQNLTGISNVSSGKGKTEFTFNAQQLDLNVSNTGTGTSVRGISNSGADAELSLNVGSANVNVETSGNHHFNLIQGIAGESQSNSTITAKNLQVKVHPNAGGKETYGICVTSGAQMKIDTDNLVSDVYESGDLGSNRQSAGIFAFGDNVALTVNAAESIKVNVQSDVMAPKSWVYGILSQSKSTGGNAQMKLSTKDLNVNVQTSNDSGKSGVGGLWLQKSGSIDIDAENTTISVKGDDGGVDKAGMVVLSGSKLTVDGNLKVEANNVISTRGGSTTTINKDGKSTVQLDGNVIFGLGSTNGLNDANATVDITLNDSNSYLNGNILKKSNNANAPVDQMTVKNMNLTAANGATWKATEDSFVNNLTLSNSGTVNMQGDGSQKITIDKLEGEGGVIYSDNLKNQAVVDQHTATNLTAKGNGTVADEILAGDKTVAQDLADIVVDKNGKSIANQITTEEGVIGGAFSADVKADGTVDLTTATQAVNTANEGVSNMGNISLMTWRQENNDMNKRLGELRASKGEHGVWARMARGEVTYGSVKNQYNYYQLGYDKKLSDGWTLGGALTYTDGQSSFAGGTGTDKHTGFAVYGSQLRDDGSFIDLIARYAYLKQDFNVAGGIGGGDYDTNAYSLSAEYGKRHALEGGLWIEPQVELTYGHIGAVTFTTTNGASVRQGSLDSLVGRLGFSIGKDISRGNVYVRASYLYDFDGDTDLVMWKGAANTSFH